MRDDEKRVGVEKGRKEKEGTWERLERTDVGCQESDDDGPVPVVGWAFWGNALGGPWKAGRANVRGFGWGGTARHSVRCSAGGRP